MDGIYDKMEEFFNKVDELLESHGYTFINAEDFMYCNDRVGYIEASYEKNGKYVDISLRLLLNEYCEPVKVKELIIDDDDNILDDELYEKINSLYKSIFKK